MSKYEPFRRYLERSPSEAITLDFGVIDELVGGLPPSAREYREWWANHRGTHVHADAWLDAGRLVLEIDLNRERVRFSAPGAASVPKTSTSTRSTRPTPSPRSARLLCPLCALDEDIERYPAGVNEWRHVCRNPTHGDYEFTSGTTTDDDHPGGETDGIAQGLGLLEDLPRCLVAGEPWVEYGVVEHRLARLRPETYRELLRRYSHTKLERRSYTTSSFLSATLGSLSRTGGVVARPGKATGYWSYNGSIFYWALPPEPPPDHLITWEEFARGEALDPLDWVLPAA